MGTRIIPDNNDIVVWNLDEAVAPFVNSSTSTSAISHAVSDLATQSGTFLAQQPSIFAASGNNSAVLFTGANGNTPRNFISGANGVQPQAPVTFSCWVYVRAFNTTGFSQHLWTKQTNTGVWSSTFSSVISQSKGTLQWDMNILPTSGSTPTVTAEYTIPLNTWAYTALTWDGTTQLAYINGVLVASSASVGPINYGTTPGPWFFGAIPSGSGNPEESVISICDFRIANIVRSQSYFQNIYKTAMSLSNQRVLITLYKLRAYDLSCGIPIYWISKSINYSEAPVAPCGGTLGPIDILETWDTLG